MGKDQDLLIYFNNFLIPKLQVSLKGLLFKKFELKIIKAALKYFCNSRNYFFYGNGVDTHFLEL